MSQNFRGKGSSLGILFGFYKTRHILLSNGENCNVLRAVVLTQYRRVTDRRTDGQTDGFAVTNTALAMRALRRAVIMKLCSRLFVLHCRSRPKYDKPRHFDPHFEDVMGGVEPCLMARWKARVQFLLSVIELFLSLAVEALRGKTCQTSLLLGEGGSL